MEPTTLPPFEQELFRLVIKHYGGAEMVLKSKIKYNDVMDSMKKILVVYALIKKKGIDAQAANMLGINRNTLRKFKLNIPNIPKGDLGFKNMGIL